MFSVVLVDDNPLTVEALEHGIDWGKHGFKVEGSFGDGQKALDYLLNHGADIVLTDIRMPQMDGIQMIQQMKESGLLTKVVVLSAYPDFTYAQQVIRYGGYGYLLKPLDEVLLEEMLDDLAAILKREEHGRKQDLCLESTRAEKSIVEKAKLFAKQNMHKAISLEEVADYVNISKNYFCNMFKNETGLTFWDFLTILRVEKAKELLRTEMKNYEIALMVGYEDAGYLSKVFRKIIGMTPSEYRNSLYRKP
ncbi:response regulator [Paenibacillus sp. KQZ6P-2]|uniref:Response regulator n=1 Tax=Paenibacillus mangrovi TaxID=2931978 RepID=A0A9X1WRU2_9BACL|nr:response regulator [Paenibacillus mangrovi]MCJ8014112.1 response regulator [Paenibacillus mangrovi]